MKLIETYKELIDELLYITRKGSFEMTQSHQLMVLRNLTFDELDKLELGKPIPEIFNNFKHYQHVVDLSFTFDQNVYPLYLYCNNDNELIAVSKEFQYLGLTDHSDESYLSGN